MEWGEDREFKIENLYATLDLKFTNSFTAKVDLAKQFDGLCEVPIVLSARVETTAQAFYI